ncbi:MAG: hypothetical protein HXS41_01180 [Theionarchaea archaeon]|nr:hypothetical protein [Theionarchaea archaeon]MBU7019640.1 hypothetical protein [Theionarchaea archaeon]
MKNYRIQPGAEVADQSWPPAGVYRRIELLKQQQREHLHEFLNRPPISEISVDQCLVERDVHALWHPPGKGTLQITLPLFKV